MGRERNTSKKRRRWLVWLVWLFELLVILAIVFAIRGWQQRTMISGEAPGIDEITLSGEQISLEDYQGKPLMLHFWASWCATCEFEQPGINKVRADWPVITVAYNSGEADEVKRYMERKGIQDWVTIVDNDGELSQEYGVIGVPATYILDGEGSIRFRELGLSSSWGLRFRMWLTDQFY